MAEYVVTWQIEVGADSPIEAAETALRYILDSRGTARVFGVKESTTRNFVTVDLTAFPPEFFNVK